MNAEYARWTLPVVAVKGFRCAVAQANEFQRQICSDASASGSSHLFLALTNQKGSASSHGSEWWNSSGSFLALTNRKRR